MTVVIAVGDEKKWKGGWEIYRGDNYQKITSLLWDKIVNKKEIREIINKIEHNKSIFYDEGTSVSEFKNGRHALTDRVYVINPNKKTLTVLSGTGEAGFEPKLVDEYSFKEAEPNWEKVEQLANTISKFYKNRQKIKA